MKTKTIVIALLVFVAVVLLVSHNEKLASDSAAQAARAQSAATGAVLAQLHGGVEGDPFIFSKMCGHPDHFRNTPTGELVWIYEQQRVMVTFMHRKKTDATWQLAYNVYDPQRFAQWGEIGFLTPQEAVAQIGCSVPNK
jgi:hypothetical protein